MAVKRDDHHVVQEKRVNEYGDGDAWIRGPLLGSGSFGRVYKATLRNPKSKHGRFPSEMAVKSAEVSVSSTLQEEGMILRSLDVCPYVIKCFGDETTLGENGVIAYNMLLEYAYGGTLADRIKKSGGRGLSELEVKMHTRSILTGLNHIHGRGYVHCDLKPDNILLVPDGGNIFFRAKISDFGLAKQRETVPYSRGTPMYLSPEAVIDNVQEAPSDVWALGCTVLEMLTGKRAWEGQKAEILRSIGAGNEFPKIPKEISEEAMHFLMCCFERNPVDRLDSGLLLCHPFLKELECTDQLICEGGKNHLRAADNVEFIKAAGYLDQANESSYGISERIVQFVLPYLE